MNFWDRIKVAKNVLTENRAGYTDSVVAALLSSATAQQNAATDTGILESALGAIYRGFLTSTNDLGIPSSQISVMVREMLTRGNSLWYRIPGETRLYPVATYDVEMLGKVTVENAMEWRYRIEIALPRERFITMHVNRDRIIHCMYAPDPLRPWSGVSPIGNGKLAANLIANLEKSLGQEAGTTTGYLLPIPKPVDGDSVDDLRTDLAGLKGKTALIETVRGGYDEGRTAAPVRDYQPSRLGPSMTQSEVELYREVQMTILSMLGVPTEILRPSDGTAAREAWRRFLHGCIAPLSILVQEELERVFKRSVTISHENLFASDVVSKARAYGSLVKGNMNPQQAGRIVGFSEPVQTVTTPQPTGSMTI